MRLVEYHRATYPSQNDAACAVTEIVEELAHLQGWWSVAYEDADGDEVTAVLSGILFASPRAPRRQQPTAPAVTR